MGVTVFLYSQDLIFVIFIFLFSFRPFQNVEVAEECVDKRSVDELLSFINGDDGG